MPHNPSIRHRRSTRLFDYDYSRPGGYFLTICAYQKACLFGEIKDGVVVLNHYGMVVREEWIKTGMLRDNVVLDEFVVMPNHFHGIVMIVDQAVDNDHRRGKARLAPTKRCFGKPPAQSICSIVGAFKSAVTKHINQIRQTPACRIWQRNYYEHIIRDEESLKQVREYVVNNPQNWEQDEYKKIIL